MNNRLSIRTESLPFVLIGISNTLPVAGYVLFGWSFTAVALLFWLEAVAVLLFYAALGMVTTPERGVESREHVAPAGPIGGRYFSETPWNPVSVLPPIYPKNLRFVVPTTAIGLLVATGAGGGVTVWGIGRRSPVDGDVTDFIAQFSVFESPPVLAAGLLIVGTQFAALGRYYFATGRYRDLTSRMALEIQMKYYVLYLLFFMAMALYALVTFFGIGVTLSAIGPEQRSVTVWAVLVAGTFLVAKLAFEWSRFRGERQPGLDDGSFTANFSPTPPPPEQRT